MKLILFDIDGTLVHSKGVGSAATHLAMEEVFGTVGSLADFRFGGKTDWQMLLETLAGRVSPAEIQRRLPEYDAVLGRHIRQLIPAYAVAPCAGAPALLERCAGRFTVGLLTANMPQTAHLKLKAAGYDPALFRFGVFGSEAPARHDLAPIALDRARQLSATAFAPESVFIIGDTPEDIACAHHIGARALAVATGRYSRAELSAHRPYRALDSLADTEAVWSLLA